MKMTQNAVRLDGCKKRIVKLQQKIERLNGLIEKKRAKIASGKLDPQDESWLEGEINWHKHDIERAERELIGEKKKLEEYISKVKSEEERDAKIPHVESVEKFLQEWKIRNQEYFRSEIKRFKEFMIEVKGLPWKERQKRIEKEFLAATVIYSQIASSEFEERLERDLDREVIALRINLFARCSEAVGVITDASHISIGSDGSLNGVVIGEEGEAVIETIGAGGYNIQRYHFRVLIKKIK